MNTSNIQKPEINPKLTYGGITSFHSQNSVTKEHNKYRFHLYLTFENHPEEVTIQRGGFEKKGDAQKAKENALRQLHDGVFVVWDFKVKELYDYWLYYYLPERIGAKGKGISYNTHMTYRNAIYNYILPAIGDKKISQVDNITLVKLMEELPYTSLFNTIKGVLYSSFSFMLNRNYISFNPIPTVFRILEGKKKEKQIEQKTFEKPKKKFKVLSAEQASYLMYSCKKFEHFDIYIPLVLSLTTGLRISESFALKFEDVNFRKKEISVQRQLGRRPDGKRITASSVTAQEIPLKSFNSNRKIPITDFILEEIILAKKRYDQMKETCHNFHDYGYITCHADGTAIPVSSAIYTNYKRLFKECNLPYIVWHDLRHTYSTLLAKNINIKAISEYMGHATEDFTQEYYVMEEEEDIMDMAMDIEKIASELIRDISVKEPISETEVIDLFSDEYLLEILPESAYNR